MKNKSIIEQYKGMSFAEASGKISKKFKDRDFDLVQKESFETEMLALHQHQENVKKIKELGSVIKQFKNGGQLPKYAYGNIIDDPNYQGVINNMQPGQISMANTWASQVDEIQPIETLPIRPFGLVGPPKPFAGQVNTQSYDNKVGPGNVFNNAPGFQTLDNPNVSTPKDAPKTAQGGSAYTPALIGQGISTALNVAMLAGGYDKAAPEYNPNEAEVKRLMQSRSIDTTEQRNQILSAYNAAKSNLGNVRSANIRQALDVNMMNQTASNLAQSKMAEQQVNNQFKGEYANTLASLGQQRAQANIYAEDLNARSKGNWQSNLSAFGVSAAEAGKFFTEKRLGENHNMLMTQIMNQKYSDFGLSPEVMGRFIKGKQTNEDIMVLKKAAKSNPKLKSFAEYITQ
jgi:hypothetical protein